MADLPITHRGMVYSWQCDINGHMNVMWYMGKFDEASYGLVAMLGVTKAYRDEHRCSVVSVQYDLSFKRELDDGDYVYVRSRLVELREKVIRVVHELIHDASGEVAATADFTGVHLDMDARKSCPFPDDVRARADAMLAEHAPHA